MKRTAKCYLSLGTLSYFLKDEKIWVIFPMHVAKGKDLGYPAMISQYQTQTTSVMCFYSKNTLFSNYRWHYYAI